jgi:hypothetical protein
MSHEEGAPPKPSGLSENGGGGGSGGAPRHKREGRFSIIVRNISLDAQCVTDAFRNAGSPAFTE